MKRHFIKATMICMIALSPLSLRAETIAHSFQSLSAASQITFYSSNKVAKTAELFYTCSGGEAAFGVYAKSPNPIVASLKKTGAKLTTGQVADLDSLLIRYGSAEKSTDSEEYVDFKVEISPDSGAVWTNMTVVQTSPGISYVKLPAKGDYFVRFSRKAQNVYIRRIDYILAPCHCLKVVEEE